MSKKEKMISCPACKKKISVATAACVHCGRPITDEERDALLKKERVDQRNAIICAVILAAGVALWSLLSDDKEQAAARPGTFSTATIRCSAALEKLAKYDYRWESTFTTNRFYTAGWQDESDVNHLVGKPGALYFQNGFGAWVLMEFSCTYDNKNGKVLKVSANARE